MGSKRSNDHSQLSKEEFEALEGHHEGENDDQGFLRTTESRRVVRARRPMIAPPPRSTALSLSTSGSANPFASVSLTTAGSSARSATASPWSLGTVATATAPKQPLFYSDSAELCRAFQSEIESLNMNSDAQCRSWLPLIRNYAKRNEAILEKWKESTGTATAAAAPAAATAAATPAPAAVTDFGSFAKAPAAALPKLTFGSPPLQSAAAAVTGGDGDDAEEVVDDEKDKIRPAVDADWTDVGEFGPVRFYRFINGSWVPFCLGQLRLQTHKINTDKSRMMLRDDSGIKLHINMSIRVDAEYKLSEIHTKKGAHQGQISVSGVNDASRGLEGFILRSNWKTSQGLHAMLQELAG